MVKEEGSVTDDSNGYEAGRQAGYDYAMHAIALQDVDEREALADLKHDRGSLPDYSYALAKAEDQTSLAILIPELERRYAQGYDEQYLVGFSEGFGKGVRLIRGSGPPPAG